MLNASASPSVTRIAVLITGVRRKNTALKIKASNGKPAGSAIPRTPQLAPHRWTALWKKRAESEKAHEKEKAEINHQLEAMIQNVVPHLVGHHFADFRQRALLEQVVVERDSGRAEEARLRLR